MKEGHDVHSGRLGIVVADQNELAGPVKVAGAAPGSPAAKAGLKPGDIMVAAAGRKVELLAHLRHALGVTDAGSAFPFSVLRGGKTIDLECTLVEQVPTYRPRYLGLEVANLEKDGVMITKVWPQTPAAAAKLTEGMLIRKCGDVAIEQRDQLRQQVSLAELDVPLQLTIQTSADAVDAQSQLAVTATVWPSKLEGLASSGNGPNGLAARGDLKIEDAELTLGDFPNKAWAWLPTLAGSGAVARPAAEPKAAGKDATEQEAASQDARAIVHEYGLLVLLPEPGEVDRNKLREIWAPLLQAGWCVAVIQSGDKTRWSAEEIELIERVRLQVAERRKLDKARTVIGGVGVGGRLALVGARAARGQVAGVLMLGTSLESVRIQRENSPSDSLHFLTVGQRESYRDFVEQLQKMGYPAVELPVPEFTPAKWDTLPVEAVVQWLIALGRI